MDRRALSTLFPRHVTIDQTICVRFRVAGDKMITAVVIG
jgi:hypothetical protein